MKKLLSLFLSLALIFCSLITGTITSGCNDKKSISVLTIGSSYLYNATDQLYPVLESLGYDDITVANIYSSGCKINAHMQNIEQDKGAYEYRKANKTTGKLKEVFIEIDGINYTNKYKMSDALTERAWDYVVINQGATEQGVTETFEKLPDYLAYVKSKAPSAKISFHMGWTFSNISTLPEFENYYESSEDVMYQAIINAIKSQVEPLNFYKIIPNGTVVRNARTSNLEELRITYDPTTYGHATADFGRYMVALTVATTLTGKDISNISYKPESVTEEEKAIAIQCVLSAINNPYQTTEIING